MNDTTTKTYNIVSYRLDGFKHDIAKLNRRAAKLGVTPITIRETGKVTRKEIKNEYTGIVSEVRESIEIELSGQTPKFAGWALAATLEHTAEGNIIRKVPTCPIDLMPYSECKPHCEHCNLQRNRKDTYLVVHDTGAVKQVGHNCIHDFLGHQSPHWLAALAEIWYSAGELGACGEEDYDGMGGYGSMAEKLVHVDSLLAYTARAVRVMGFVSRKAQEAAAESGKNIETTKSIVLSWMFPSTDKDARAAIIKRYCVDGEEWPKPTEADSEFAVKAREFVQAEIKTKAALKPLTEFENNLLVCSKMEAIEFRTCGIAAFIVEYYRRAIEGEAKRKAAQANKPNIHFGEVGKRFKKLEVSYLGCASFESMYGWCYIHRFETADGARLVWKTSNDLGYETGAKLVATFTVKEHGDYKGWKQTSVSRMVCDIVEEKTAVRPRNNVGEGA